MEDGRALTGRVLIAYLLSMKLFDFSWKTAHIYLAVLGDIYTCDELGHDEVLQGGGFTE